MLGQGFLGTRADWLMDLVILSLVVIIPIITFSWYRVRQRGYLVHKRIQVWLTVILTVVVLLFELDLRISGGLEVLTQSSRFYDTVLMALSIYIHLSCSLTY